MKHRAIAVALLLCVSAAPALAEAPMAGHLPRRTLAYIGWAGWNDAMEKSLLGQLVQEPAAKELWAGLRRMLVESSNGRNKEMLSHVWEVGTTLLKRPGAIGLVDLDLPQDGPPNVVVALVVDLGETKAAFQKHLSALLAKLPEDVPVENRQGAGGVAFTEIRLKGGPMFRLAYKGNLLVATLGKAGADLLNVTTEQSLLTNPTFKQQFAAVDGRDVQDAMFIDAAAILKRVDHMLGPPLGAEDRGSVTPRKVIAALGADKLQGLVAATRVVGEGMASKTRIFTPAPHDGLMALFAGGKLTEADLAHVPADADFFFAIKLSPQRVLDQIRRGIKIVDPSEIEDFQESLGELEEQLGLSLEKELFPAMGDTWVLASAPSYGGFLTGTVLTVDLKDPAAFRKALDKIVAMMKREFPGNRPRPAEEGRRRRYPRGPAVEEVTIRGVKIQYVSFAGRDVPFAPAWAVHGNKLYVALFPQVVATAATMPAAKSITQSPAYAALRKRMGEGPAILSYADLGSISRQLYNVLLVGWTMGSNYLSREWLPQAAPHWLPSMAALSKYLKPSLSAVRADAKGVTFESYEAVPVPAVGSVAILASIMLPAVGRARALTKVSASALQLNNIAKAIETYASFGAKKVYPPDLEAVVKEARLSPGNLRSPLDDRPPPRLVNGKLVGESSFVYIKGHSDSSGAQLIVAYLPAKYHPDGRVLVAYVDASVRQLEPEEFHRQLARTMRALKEAAKRPRRPREDF